jgi:hypothetical protein
LGIKPTIKKAMIIKEGTKLEVSSAVWLAADLAMLVFLY